MAKLLLSIVLLGLAAQSFALPAVLKVWPSRIVGGEPAEPKELPFQLSLRFRGNMICGASILSESVIVTAAHCSVLGDANLYSVVAGDHNRDVNEGTEQVRDVSSVLVHPEYDDWWITNDIALMVLSEPLQFDDYVQPIKLAKAGHTATGDAVTSGWGTTSESGSTAVILQKVTVPIVTDGECRDAYGDEIFDHMLCAGIPEGGKDACQGDSGGPLTATDLDDERYLAGIVSWGYGCARPGFPGVYTEVSYFVDWVLNSGLLP